MTNWDWSDWSSSPNAAPDGIAVNRGSHGISVSAEQAARFGHLFLNEGRWDNEQVVDADWVRTATSVQVDPSLPLNPRNYVISIFGENAGPGIYGYGWWTNGQNSAGRPFLPGASPDTYLAYGIDNNVVVVVPEWDMVVVREASNETPISNSVLATFLSLVGDAVMDGADPAGLPYEQTRLPYAIYRTRDTNVDGSGDRVDNVLSNAKASIGETDTAFTNSLGDLVAKFALPIVSNLGSGIQFDQATLRFYLETVVGTPIDPVSVFHSVTDNDILALASDHEDSTYTDTLFDLVQPSDEGGNYYEIDVTAFVQSDYDADGDNPLSAFRLQVSDTLLEDNKSSLYEFAIGGSQVNYPELVLNFVVPGLSGDFTGDGLLNTDDIDLLTSEIAAGEPFNIAAFDLSGDGSVDDADVSKWLSDAAHINGFRESYLDGDSNLDGTVDAADLNNLALNWQQSIDKWSGGDFTADGVVNSADLNALALHWRQSIAMASSATAPVPEPSAWLLTFAGLAFACRLPRHRFHKHNP